MTTAPEVTALRDEFLAALRDDFNTPRALAALFKLVSEGNRRLGGKEPLPGAAAAFAEMLQVVGLESLQDRPDESGRGGAAPRWASARMRAGHGTSTAPTQSATSCSRAGWEVRDTPEGPVLVPAE